MSNCNNFHENDLLLWQRHIDSSITLINDTNQWTNGMFYAWEWHPGIDHWKAILKSLQVWNSICGHKCQPHCPLFTLEFNLALIEMIQYVKLCVKICRTKNVFLGMSWYLFLFKSLFSLGVTFLKITSVILFFLLYISPVKWVRE